MNRKLIISLSIAASMLACRPAPRELAASKSMDNLVSRDGAAVVNQCQGPYTMDQTDAATLQRMQAQLRYPKDAEADVLAALSSIPNGLKRVFFGFGYELEFRHDARAVCAQGRPAAQPEGAGILGCAVPARVSTAGGEAETLKLYVSADARDARHGTLLAFTSVVAKKLGHVAFEGATPVLRDEEDEGSKRFRRSLAVLAVHDQFAARGAGFSRFKELLPTEASFHAVATTVEARGKIWAAFAQAVPEKAARFESLVFENMMDSYYCSTVSRQTVERDFPVASALFAEEMVPVVKRLGGETASDAGLGLWGRWGFGNGPMRQFFANRMDDTGYAFPRLHGMRRAWNGDGWVYPTSGLGWRLRGDYESAEDGGYDWDAE